MSVVAWVIANGTETRFRGWGDVGFIWVDRKDDAIWYARRDDAEKVAAEDIDAWLILPIDELAFERDRLHVEFDILKTAAERDRLQQQLGEATLRIETDARLIASIQAERDHRRAEMDSWKASYVTTEKYANDLAALRAEKAELIAALEDIADDHTHSRWCRPGDALRKVARAALAKATATEET